MHNIMKVFVSRNAVWRGLQRSHDDVVARAVRSVIGSGEGTNAVFGIFLFRAKANYAQWRLILIVEGDDVQPILDKEGAHLFEPEQGFGGGLISGLGEDLEVRALGECPAVLGLQGEGASTGSYY